MNKGSLLKVLNHLGVVFAKTQNRQGWVIAHCPFAQWTHEKGYDNNPSFGVTHSTNESSRYNCFSCGERGDLMDLVLDLRQKGFAANFKEALPIIENEENEIELDIPDYEDEIDSEKIITWPEYYLESFQLAVHSKKARTYLKSRNVPLQIAEELDLRYDSDRERVCFPMRTWKGHLAGLHGRDVTGKHDLPYYAYRYNGVWNKMLWYGESWIDPDMPVVVVESVFDLTSVYRVYRNVMCSLSCGFTSKKVSRISNISDLTTMYDFGKGGDRARKTIRQGMKQSNIVDLIPTEKQNDPGNMSVDEVVGYLQEHVLLDKQIM